MKSLSINNPKGINNFGFNDVPTHAQGFLESFLTCTNHAAIVVNGIFVF